MRKSTSLSNYEEKFFLLFEYGIRYWVIRTDLTADLFLNVGGMCYMNRGEQGAGATGILLCLHPLLLI